MTGEAPRRRQPPAVYRRRRLVVVVLLLMVVAAAIWLFVAQPWRGNAAEKPHATASTPAATPKATSSPAVAATADDDAARPPAEGAVETPAATDSAKPCAQADLTIEAKTDADSYQAGQNPQLSIGLTNKGAKDCTLNVGTSQQSFTITSGNDTWWRSTDCQTDPSDMVVTIAAGQTVTSATPVAWDRTRSAVATCADSNRAIAPAGGASYHLSVAIGGIASGKTAQFLLY